MGAKYSNSFKKYKSNSKRYTMGQEITDFDKRMMQRCFKFAENGAGHVAPNPMVGCVITHEDKIIGEGFHRAYGKPHAEVNAIHSVKKIDLLKKATLYVNLEPCAHHGKTPPCSDLIAAHQIPRVVISNVDPYAKVAGKGIEKLEAAGTEVIHGVKKAKGWFLNSRFFTYHTQKRPWIILKWAESADGFLDIYRDNTDDLRPTWLTNQMAKHLVHRWRAEEQSILVGQNTALLDNPKLNTREWHGSNPLRILIDPELKVPSGYHILDKNQKTLVFNWLKAEKNNTIEYIKIGQESSIIHAVIEELFKRSIQSVIVEGGAYVLQHFINANMWDETRRFIGQIHLKDGIKAPDFKEIPASKTPMGNSILYKYFRESDLLDRTVKA